MIILFERKKGLAGFISEHDVVPQSSNQSTWPKKNIIRTQLYSSCSMRSGLTNLVLVGFTRTNTRPAEATCTDCSKFSAVSEPASSTRKRSARGEKLHPPSQSGAAVRACSKTAVKNCSVCRFLYCSRTCLTVGAGESGPRNSTEHFQVPAPSPRCSSPPPPAFRSLSVRCVLAGPCRCPPPDFSLLAVVVCRSPAANVFVRLGRGCSAEGFGGS